MCQQPGAAFRRSAAWLIPIHSYLILWSFHGRRCQIALVLLWIQSLWYVTGYHRDKDEAEGNKTRHTFLYADLFSIHPSTYPYISVILFACDIHFLSLKMLLFKRNPPVNSFFLNEWEEKKERKNWCEYQEYQGCSVCLLHIHWCHILPFRIHILS